MGQNIAQAGTSGNPQTDTNLVGMVESWYNEVKDFDRNDVRRFKYVYLKMLHTFYFQVYSFVYKTALSFNFYSSLNGKNGKTVGHYTQLVWAKSNRLGCGSRNYNDGTWKWRYLVCNYGPTGNWIGEPIYEPK